MVLKKLQSLKLFWSYDISKHKPSDEVIVEQFLKYGDTKDLIELFKNFDGKEICAIWQKTMQNDNRFLRQNYFLLKFFLPKIKKTIESTRINKLKKLATQH